MGQHINTAVEILKLCTIDNIVERLQAHDTRYYVHTIVPGYTIIILTTHRCETFGHNPGQW